MNLKSIIELQKEYFNSQSTRDVKMLKKLLAKLRIEIIKREDEIYEALYRDFKKSKFETYFGEIGIVIAEIESTIKQVNSWSKPKKVRSSLLNFPSSDYIYSEPYGSVLIIAPWNYPFQLAIAPLIAAIAAGNTVILKPSEHTLNTSKVLESIISNVFKPEHVKVIEGGIPETTLLLKERWDYIFFTGSVPVGKIVAKAAAVFLTPSTLELGGKTPCIIDETVSTKLVAKRLVWGKFVNAGQTCIAPDYLLVHKSVKEELIFNLKKEIILNDDDRLNIGYEKLQDYLEDVTKAMLIALLDGNAKRTTNLNSNTLTEKREIFYNALKREQYKDTTNKPWSNWRDTHSSVNISTVSKTNNVVTVTTSAAHGLDMSYDDWGAVIVINNSDFDIVSANYPNGVPIILTGADTFTYAKSGPDVAITSVSGTGDIKIGWGGDSNNLHLYFT